MSLRRVLAISVVLLLAASFLAPTTNARREVTGLELVSALPLPGGTHGDVWYHADHAYVGTWSSPCEGAGVNIVDVHDPAAPVHVGAVASYPDTSAEDIVVHHVRTQRFTGDLLAAGLQACGPEGKSGLDLWDVTDPTAPAHLAFFFTGGHGVHELSMTTGRSDGRILALVAVPYSETAPAFPGGEARIIDVTDPHVPFLASDWGIIRERGEEPGGGMGAFPADYAHSVAASPDGRTAYVSYWDAGVQILDIADPGDPRIIGSTPYPEGAEGNAHSVDVDPRRHLLFQADEDFSARMMQLRVSSPAAAVISMPAVEAEFGPRIGPELAVQAPLVDAGRACANDTLTNVASAVALVTRGDCAFMEKTRRVQEAGAVAIVITNNIAGPPGPMGADIDNATIPAFMIGMNHGATLRTVLETGPVEVELSETTAALDPWGTLRIFDIRDPTRPVQIGEYATPHARNDPVGEDPNARYSIHNPLVLGRDRLVVTSWFGDGVRVLDMRDPKDPQEVASWTPPPAPENAPASGTWGVAVDRDIIYASDMAHGLHILKMTRP